jgi:hypothetical protein
MPGHFPPFGTPSHPRWPFRVALTVCAVAAVCLLAKRDHDQQARVDGQQARIDGLTQEIAALSDLLRNDARQPAAPVPCALDSRQIAAIEQAAVAARSALGAAPPPVASSSAAPAQGATHVELDDQQESALARANDVLAAALRRRTLTGDDVTTLHRELAVVGPSDETRELRRKIVVAVNRGELVPDGPYFVP